MQGFRRRFVNFVAEKRLFSPNLQKHIDPREGSGDNLFDELELRQGRLEAGAVGAENHPELTDYFSVDIPGIRCKFVNSGTEKRLVGDQRHIHGIR